LKIHESDFPRPTNQNRIGIAPHDDPAYDALLIGYVSNFVPKQTGDQFSPHVSTGVAPRDYLDKMLAEPFAPFTFSPAGACGS